jgi:hypothetical protein
VVLLVDARLPDVCAMFKRMMAGFTFAVLAAASTVPAADQTPKIPSALVEKQVKKLTQKVQWCSSLDEAKEKAEASKKLIFWLHALGDLDGTT